VPFELVVVLFALECLDLAEATLALTPLAMLFIKSIFVNAKLEKIHKNNSFQQVSRNQIKKY
jgi:hypothetical protein